MVGSQTTLDVVKERLNEYGDLPIFSASVNRIQLVSADPESDVMQLAMEVMKDASLSTKLLKLVNSPYYHRGGARIGSVVQAVMLLGFDTIRNVCLTLKLLDSFSTKDNSSELAAMLVQSYISGGVMREVARSAGIDDSEQCYLLGLLYNLGEMIVAHTLPDKYLEIQTLSKAQGVVWGKAQQSVLRTNFCDLGQHLADEWGFPCSIAKVLGMPPSDEVTPASSKSEFNAKVSSRVNALMGNLYQRGVRTSQSYAALLEDIAEVSGLESGAVQSSVERAFKQACDLAEAFSLNKKLLAPKVAQTGDALRDRMAKQFAYYANSSGPVHEMELPDFDDEAESAEGKDKKPDAQDNRADAGLLLKYINELTVLMGSKATLNAVILKMLEGINAASGFERVVLCLLNPQRTAYAGRIAVGANAEALKEYFNFAVDTERDLFSQIMMFHQQQSVADVKEPCWAQRLPPAFAAKTGANGFAVSYFGIEGKPLGMVYADMGLSQQPIGLDQYQSFCQLISHARLALRVQ
ncbi:MAG: HDOD domain-containing protein [Pseudomonadota bacterium]